MKNVNICVIGAGQWGINHIKTLILLNVNVGCIEINKDKLNSIKNSFPQITCFSTIEDSLEFNYHGYVIATPASSHAKLAKLLISKNKAVLVEKPLCLSVADSEEIKSQLKKFKGKLIVGHLMMFHPAVIKIKNPKEYIQKLKVHNKFNNFKNYYN